jgi:CRP-like cAMP-binding protein
LTAATDDLKDKDELIARMRSIPVLTPFSERDLEGLLKLSRVVQYEPGDPIIEEGQFDNRIYFLLRGKVVVRKQGEQIGTLRRTGDLFGEMGIIDGSPRSASIAALERTVCLVVDVSYMDRLEGNERNAFSAVLYRLFSEILCGRLRAMDERIIRLQEENGRLRRELEALKRPSSS